MIKVMTIVGTRPELIKMCRVIAEFDQHVDHVLVHTGQNYDYELNQIFFDDLGIRKPDYFLNAVGENAAQTIGRVIEKSDSVLRKEAPDSVLIYGDTNSCLAVIAAKRLKIPVFHMEAGNRCFNQMVPEELNRKVIDHLSDVNLVLTEHARLNLLKEGVESEMIFKVGSHMPEVLNFYQKEIASSQVLEKNALSENEYFLFSIHREENLESENFVSNFLTILETLESHYDLKIVVSTHPRTKKILDENTSCLKTKKVSFLKPFGFFDYIKLQKNALCVISDSGTITEEASIIDFPAVTLRIANERPEGMEAGVLIMSSLDSCSILNAVETTLKQRILNTHENKAIHDYKSQNVAKKILRIVLSYTDIVNRKVWYK